ncbi:MAG: hypothetical protein GX220_03565 [Treponema sp.]|nr:hypothetical protein [Treponema sp.]
MKNIKIFILIAVIFSIVACASIDDLQIVEGHVKAGQYEQALFHVEENKDILYDSKDKVLYFLDTGLLFHYNGDYEKSVTVLTEAEKLMYEYFSKSITQALGTYLVNDKVTDYAGEDFEDIYINIFNALNYINNDNIESAFVEIRRFDNKQKELQVKYAKSIDSAREQAAKHGSQYTSDLSSEFHNSAMARYLSMLLYRSEGKLDSATIDKKMIVRAFNDQKNIYTFSMPQNLDEEFNIPEGKARINFVSFSGISPEKIEEVVRIPYSDINNNLNYMQIAFPKMQKRSSDVAGVRVTLKKNIMPTLAPEVVSRAYLAPIESIENIALDTFARKQPLIYFRAIVRGLTKTATSEGMDVAGQNIGGSVGLALSVFSFFNDLSNKLTERADTRVARYFPAIASVGGINVEPGIYDVFFEYVNNSGVVISSETKTNFEIKKGKLNLVESICLK